jgi:FKBP-type peptidyl-prolyl cis-trans isomerase SlyD
MVIGEKKVVSLVYELQVEGEVIESLNDAKPLTFIYGTGALLPKFEEYIKDKKVGDAFEFELQCEDAYGLATEEAVVEIPKSVFEVDGQFDSEMVQEGNAIPMMDGSGNRLNGVVVSVGAENVTMDFNHPLAGDNLNFKGKVVEVREATEEELTHGHLHGDNGGGCGCGDGGSCGSGGCGEGCESEASGSSCGCGCN